MKASSRKPLVRINYELYKRRITPRATVLYHLLADGMCSDRREVRIDKPSVASDLGVSVPTLMRYLRILVKSGFLINKKEKTADGMHKYIILMEPINVPEDQPKTPRRIKKSQEKRDVSKKEAIVSASKVEKPVINRNRAENVARNGSVGRVDLDALARVKVEGLDAKLEKEIREEVAREDREYKTFYDRNPKSGFEKELPSSSSPENYTPFVNGFVPDCRDEKYEKRMRMLREKAEMEKKEKEEQEKQSELKKMIAEKKLPPLRGFDGADFKSERNISLVSNYVEENVEYFKLAFSKLYRTEYSSLAKKN